MFQFNNLQELHNDMKNKKETSVIFPFSFNNKNFNCIFFTDIYPYQFSLTPVGNDNLIFELNM